MGKVYNNAQLSKKFNSSFAAFFLFVILFFSTNLVEAQLYWNTNGTAANITATNWGTVAAGPFTSAWSAGSNINFTANSTVNYITNTAVSNITIINGSTVTLNAAGTYNTGGAVRTFDIGSGSGLIWNGQTISTAAGTGFIKNGLGTWNIGAQGNAYIGGFTLNAGTVIVGGTNALGSGGSFTVNGGIIVPNTNGARDLSGKFTTMTVGGDFQFGDAVNVAAGTGSLTFSNNITIAASRTITIGGTASYILTGVVSGAGGLGVSGISTGNLLLKGVNTYTGSTSINSGELRLNPTGNVSLNGACVFNGGLLSASGITAARTITFGSLSLSDNSTLALASATNHTITFTSLGTLTAAKILTITGWTGNYASGNTPAVTAAGKIFIGTALTAAQLNQIRFSDGTNLYYANQLASGEIVPCLKYSVSVPTPASPTAGAVFSVTVNTIRVDGTAVIVPNASNFSLSTNGNAGTIGGTTTGTVAAATSSIVVSGITLSTAGTAATLTATRTSGDWPQSGTSPAFDVTSSSSPSLSISGTLAHGASCPGTATTTQTYTITNGGSVPATGIAVVSSDPQFVVSNLSSTNIAASGGTATYDVTFIPAAPGAQSSLITVTSTTSGSNSPSNTVTGTGTATIAQVVTASAATPITAQSARLNGNVTTLGVCPATIEKGFVYSQTSINANPLVLGTGVTKTAVAGVATGAYFLDVTGLPSSTNYSYKAYVYDGTTYTYSTPVITFTTLPALVVTGTASHGTVCPTVAATPVTYTITNNGNITVSGIAVASDNVEFAVSGLSSTSIIAGGTATYTVTFTPASAGAKTANITTSSTTAGIVSAVSIVSGTGTTPVAQAVTTNAASVVVNTTATLNGTVNTLGICPATIQKGFVYSLTATNNDPLNAGTGVTTTPVGTATTGAYNLALSLLASGQSYSFKAYVFDGTTYTYGAVQTFITLLPADHLTFVGVPTSGSVGLAVASFTVEARRPDNSVDVTYTGNVTIAKASGSGNLSGTLTVSAVAGVATFNTAQFDAEDTYTISVSSGSLTGSISGSIVIGPAPVNIWSNPITDTDPSTANPYTNGQTFDGNITVSGIGRGTGIAGATASNRYAATGWTTSNSIDVNDYFTFTLTPNANYKINFASLVYTGQASGTGPTNFAIKSSLDAFGATTIGTPTATGTTIILSAATYQNITGAITFRFYGYNAGAAGGTFSINDFQFNGVVVSTLQTVTISNTGTPAAGFITPNTTNVVLSAFNLTPTASTDFTAVTITKTGTATTADVSNLRIFYDANANSIIDGGETSVSGAGIALANSMVFGTITGQTAFSTVRRYLVVADVSAGATLGRNLTTSVAAATDITTTITNKTGTATGALQTIDYVSATTDYFRSNVPTGDWNTAASWQSSPDNTNWITATLVPTTAAAAITIRTANIITAKTMITIDKTSVDGTLQLLNDGNVTTNGGITLANGGATDELTINNGGMLQCVVSSTSLVYDYEDRFIYSTNGNIKVNTGGKITIGDGTNAHAGLDYWKFGTEAGTSVNWANGSIFEWNTTSVQSIASAGSPIYFPDVTATVIPILRFSATPTGTTGSVGNTIINGILDIRSNMTFSGTGAKTFRDGITGTATFTLPATIGTTTISSTSGVLGGASLTIVLNKQLNAASNLTVVAGSNVRIADGSTSGISKPGIFNVAATAVFDIGTTANIVNSSGSVVVDGTFKTGNTSGLYGTGAASIATSTVPVLNTGSTVEYNGAGNQAIQLASTVPYKNLVLSNGGVKTPSTAFNPAGIVTIKDNATFDCTLANVGDATTGLTMTDNSILLLGTTGSQPLMAGTYSLTGGTVKFLNSSVTTQNIRSETYYNIDVVGTSVKNGGGNITLGNGGTFTVKTNAVLEMSDFSIIGPTGTQTLIVENNGTFKCAVEPGFIGPAAFPNSPAVRDNIETITLQQGSTVDYSRSNPPLVSGDQSITNTIPYQNLKISGTGNKTAPSGDLIILGDMDKSNTSVFVHNGGTVKLNGTIAQNITATTPTPQIVFNNLQVNNATGVEVKSDFSVYRKLTLSTSGKLDFTATGDLSLKSDAGNTANVDLISGTASINYIANGGRFIVERYIATNTHGRAWQFLATPTQGTQTIRQSWQENNASGVAGAAGLGTLINGPGGSGNGFDGSTGINIKNYIPSTDQWSTTNPANTSAGIFNANGWMLFVRGDRSSTQTNSAPTVATVLRTRGQLFEAGNATLTVPSNVAVTPAGKYQSAGNPYASSIDIRALTRSNLTDEIYVWDPSLGGGYGFGKYRTLTLVGSNFQVTPFDGSGNYPALIVNRIQSGQAFFVKAQPGLTGTLGFPQSAKTDSSSLVSRGGSGIDNIELIRVNLTAKNTSGEPELMDGTMAIFGDYSLDLDYHDGIKFMNSGENTALRVNAALVAVERRPSPVAADTLYLEMSGMRQTDYHWNVSTEYMNKPGRNGWVYDGYLRQSTPINLNGETTVDFTVSADPLSAAADRFRIVFNKVTAPLPVTFIGITAARNADRSIHVQWKVATESEINTYTVERSANGSSFTGILSETAANRGTYGKNDLSPLAADNYYRIKATSFSGEISYSDIVKVAPLPVKASISVYPNPIEGKTAQLIFTNQPQGNYKIQVINKLGQVVYNGSVQVTGYSFVKQLVLSETVAQGTYQVKVVDEGGKVVSQQVVVN